jgi:hypothetical protein
MMLSEDMTLRVLHFRPNNLKHLRCLFSSSVILGEEQYLATNSKSRVILAEKSGGPSRWSVGVTLLEMEVNSIEALIPVPCRVMG